MFQTPITISEAIKNIENQKYLLPAIQREFEWSHTKIEWLFDSIMRNYPIGSFLFWRVEGSTKTSYKFYKFLLDYKEKYKTHNEEINTSGINDFTAILDGQQRLTSLYIGLRGSYAYRLPRLWEENSERVYPTRHLYLNIENPLTDEEDGRIYEFKFLTKDEYANNPKKWFKVSTIYGLSDDFDFNKYLDDNNLKENEFSYRSLSTLKNVIHSKQIINFFLETEQNLDKALNIFIRINSGGEPLSFSDLLMSIAVANWKEKDARKEIHELVDVIWSKGYSVTKDFILKTFLFLHSKDIKFKVTNFSINNAKKFESEWNKIRDAILTAFDLVKTFGFNNSTLTSKNALIPIIYYIYHKNIYNNYHTKIEYKEERESIKFWLHVVLLKRVFGAQADSILTQIRKSFTDDIDKEYIKSNIITFNPEVINANIKRDLSVGDEFIESLLLTQINEQYSFSILALLYPNLDYKNNNFHMDHMHPAAKYNDLSDKDKQEFGWPVYNSILNLQMLDANENMSKNASDLVLWVTNQTKNSDKKKFLEDHLIPDVNLELNNFKEFITERKKMLQSKLKELLQ